MLCDPGAALRLPLATLLPRLRRYGLARSTANVVTRAFRYVWVQSLLDEDRLSLRQMWWTNFGYFFAVKLR